MPTILDFPTIVQDALAIFGDVLDNEPARRHCAAYLTGLMVAAREASLRWTTRWVDHAGTLIEDVGWSWDHADQRYMIAHDYLSNIEENFIALFEFETAAKLRDQIKELQA